MMPSRIYELRNLYFQQSRDSDPREDKGYENPPVLNWPEKGYFGKFQLDADLLQQAISPQVDDDAQSLSDRVFGNELRHQKIDLKHAANLFYERGNLHTRHIEDIDDRHLKVQERLFGVEINQHPDRARRLGALEGQLLQLEQQRRDEELTFWKDTVELRQQLFESAGDYRGASHRYSILGKVEKEYG